MNCCHSKQLVIFTSGNNDQSVLVCWVLVSLENTYNSISNKYFHEQNDQFTWNYSLIFYQCNAIFSMLRHILNQYMEGFSFKSLWVSGRCYCHFTLWLHIVWPTQILSRIPEFLKIVILVLYFIVGCSQNQLVFLLYTVASTKG